jgi:hypothetical protein
VAMDKRPRNRRRRVGSRRRKYVARTNPVMASESSAVTTLASVAAANGPGMRRTRAPQPVVRAWKPGVIDFELTIPSWSRLTTRPAPRKAFRS